MHRYGIFINFVEKHMIMTEIEKTQFFDGKKIRTVWDDEKQEWFFSIKDVVSILAETSNAKDYIAKMRRRDPELSKGWGQIVHPLSIQTPGDSKKRTALQWMVFSV